MNFKVDYNEIGEIGKFINQKDSELKSNFDEILALFTSVSECWNGSDSQNFVAKATNYVNLQIQEREKIARLGNALCQISTKYSENDVEWERQMKRMGARQ